MALFYPHQMLQTNPSTQLPPVMHTFIVAVSATTSPGPGKKITALVTFVDGYINDTIMLLTWFLMWLIWLMVKTILMGIQIISGHFSNIPNHC